MKYIPTVMSLDGELKALKHENYGSDIMPFIQIIKDVKVKNGTASILNDIESLVKSKPEIFFLITVPRNLNLSKKSLKKPVATFFDDINKNTSYHSNILNRFCIYPNVIPVTEVDLKNYTTGDLKSLKHKLHADKVCYRVDAKKLSLIEDELFNLIKAKDYLNLNYSSPR